MTVNTVPKPLPMMQGCHWTEVTAEAEGGDMLRLSIMLDELDIENEWDEETGTILIWPKGQDAVVSIRPRKAGE